MNTSLAYTLHKLVSSMDKGADKLLRQEYGISYQRAYFMFTLQQLGSASQQELAATLGYSAASVSAMAAELAKEGYVVIQPHPTHGRKHIVSLSTEGQEHVEKGSRLLNEKFSNIVKRAGINEAEYLRLTQALYDVMTESRKDTI